MTEENRMLNLAKKWMIEYLGDGKVRMPSDFDEDFMGGVDIMGCTGIVPMKWNGTPFFYALGELVNSGEVEYWQDESGYHCYKLGA